jgi:hypothetical protein
MTEALQWGSVDLLPTESTSTALGYMVEASADGTSWGNPEAVITAIQSRLQDGSLAIVDSFQNREAPVHIRVTSPTYQGLVNAEAALVAETRRSGYNTLSWTPNVALAVPSVFDVIYGLLTFDFDDLGEVNLERHFVATLTCLPFARSATEIVATALPAPPVTETKVNIDNGSATTGWTANYLISTPPGPTGTTVTTSGGAVQASAPSSMGAASVAMTKTATISSLGTTPYIIFDWKVSGGAPVSMLGTGVNGAQQYTLDKISEGPSPTSGYTRTYFKVPAAVTSLTAVSLSVTIFLLNVPTTKTLFIDTVDRTDTPPASGTRRQLTRTLPVAGTMRTQGRLSVQHETSSLGEVLVYAYQDGGLGYTPPLRPYYNSGGSVATDLNLVSGGSNMLDTLVSYHVPANKLIAGDHHLYAKLKGDSGGPVTVNITASTRFGSTDVSGTITTSATITVSTAYAIYDLAALALPSTLVPDGSAAVVRITIVDADTSGIDITLDEAWLFNLDIGTLNHVDCGSAAPAVGGPSKRLWLDPATVSNDGQDAIYRGHTNDLSDAFHPATDIKGWTPPLFEPPSMTVFTVTTNALDAAVELRHFPRFLHNVGVVP